MNNKDLDILLNKFYNGETTLDEEQILRQELAGDDADNLLMQVLDHMEETVEVPNDLEMSLSKKIDEWDAAGHKVAAGQRMSKVSFSFWKRSAWAAAASVAVLAAVGWWLMRDGSHKETQKPPVIMAKTDKNPVQDVSAQNEDPENDIVLSEVPSQTQQKSKLPTNAKAASAFKSNVEYIAQTKANAENEESLISETDEEIAIAALEKFSKILNKGMNQLDNAEEKINDINNTVQQHLI